MRLGEKKILKFYFNFSKYCLGLLEIKDESVILFNFKLIYKYFLKKIMQKLKADYGDSCPLDFYVYDVLIKLIEAETEDSNTNISN